MNKIKAFVIQNDGTILATVAAIALITGVIGFFKWIDRGETNLLQTRACKRIVEVGLGTTFDKHTKFHMESCLAGMDVVEEDFKQINLPEIAKGYFECMATGETQEDFDFCHEFKSKRLAQEHYRISREEADE